MADPYSQYVRDMQSAGLPVRMTRQQWAARMGAPQIGNESMAPGGVSRAAGLPQQINRINDASRWTLDPNNSGRKWSNPGAGQVQRPDDPLAGYPAAERRIRLGRDGALQPDAPLNDWLDTQGGRSGRFSTAGIGLSPAKLDTIAPRQTLYQGGPEGADAPGAGDAGADGMTPATDRRAGLEQMRKLKRKLKRFQELAAKKSSGVSPSTDLVDEGQEQPQRSEAPAPERTLGDSLKDVLGNPFDIKGNRTRYPWRGLDEIGRNLQIDGDVLPINRGDAFTGGDGARYLVADMANALASGVANLPSQVLTDPLKTAHEMTTAPAERAFSGAYEASVQGLQAVVDKAQGRDPSASLARAGEDLSTVPTDALFAVLNMTAFPKAVEATRSALLPVQQMPRAMPPSPPISAGINKAFARPPADKAAADLLLRDLKRDNLTPDLLAQNAQRISRQPGATREMLFEAGGENTRRLARAAASVPGKAVTAADEAFKARDAAMFGDMSRAVGATGKKGGDFVGEKQRIIGERKQASKAAYDAFRASPVDQNVFNAQIAPTLASDYGREALAATAKGFRMKSNSARAGARDFVDDAFAHTADDFETLAAATEEYLAGRASTLPPAALDEVKKHFNGLIENATGHTRSLLRESKNAFSQAVDSATGGTYAIARDQFSGGKAIEDAFDLGVKAPGMKTWQLQEQIGEIAQRYQAFGTDQTDALAQGFARGLLDMIEGGEASAARRIMRDHKIEQNFRALMGNAKWKRFEGQVSRIVERNANRNFVMGGSPTARIAEDIADRADTGSLDAALARIEQSGLSQIPDLKAMFVNAVSKPTAAVMRNMITHFRRNGVRDEEINAILGDWLFRTATPAKVSEVTDRLNARLAEKGMPPVDPTPPAALAAPAASGGQGGKAKSPAKAGFASDAIGGGAVGSLGGSAYGSQSDLDGDGVSGTQADIQRGAVMGGVLGGVSSTALGMRPMKNITPGSSEMSVFPKGTPDAFRLNALYQQAWKKRRTGERLTAEEADILRAGDATPKGAERIGKAKTSGLWPQGSSPQQTARAPVTSVPTTRARQSMEGAGRPPALAQPPAAIRPSFTPVRRVQAPAPAPVMGSRVAMREPVYQGDLAWVDDHIALDGRNMEAHVDGKLLFLRPELKGIDPSYINEEVRSIMRDALIGRTDLARKQISKLFTEVEPTASPMRTSAAKPPGVSAVLANGAEIMDDGRILMPDGKLWVPQREFSPEERSAILTILETEADRGGSLGEAVFDNFLTMHYNDSDALLRGYADRAAKEAAKKKEAVEAASLNRTSDAVEVLFPLKRAAAPRSLQDLFLRPEGVGGRNTLPPARPPVDPSQIAALDLDAARKIIDTLDAVPKRDQIRQGGQVWLPNDAFGSLDKARQKAVRDELAGYKRAKDTARYENLLARFWQRFVPVELLPWADGVVAKADGPAEAGFGASIPGAGMGTVGGSAYGSQNDLDGDGQVGTAKDVAIGSMIGGGLGASAGLFGRVRAKGAGGVREQSFGGSRGAGRMESRDLPVNKGKGVVMLSAPLAAPALVDREREQARKPRPITAPAKAGVFRSSR